MTRPLYEGVGIFSRTSKVEVQIEFVMHEHQERNPARRRDPVYSPKSRRDAGEPPLREPLNNIQGLFHLKDKSMPLYTYALISDEYYHYLCYVAFHR
jgi:hypothetical protein